LLLDGWWGRVHLPLLTEQGFLLRVPDIFVLPQLGCEFTIAVSFSAFIPAASRKRIAISHWSNALQATQMALARETETGPILGGVNSGRRRHIELGYLWRRFKLTSAEADRET